MIERALDLFVERIEQPPGPRGSHLSATYRLLVVDACAAAINPEPTFALLAQRLAVAAQVVRCEQLGDAAQMHAADGVWILVDADSDIAYCELLRDQLACGLRDGASLIAVGPVGCELLAGALEPRHLGAGKPWRRRRDRTDGALAARQLLAELGAGA